MSFVAATKAEILRRAEDDKFRAVLQLLLDEAVGHQRALPGELIASVLLDKGVKVTKNEIQNRLIRESRAKDANYFIGSCSDGFFIIDTAADVLVMQEFYEHRIAAEQRHLKALIDQATTVGLFVPQQPIAAAA